jgi:hypothetical protein
MKVRVVADEILVDDYPIAKLNPSAPPSVVARFLELLQRLFARHLQDWNDD